MEFRKNNISFILRKNKFESTDNFVKRGNFIISQNKNNLINNFDEIELYSNLWINYRVKGCKYKNNIIKNIIKLENNIY